MVTSTDSSKNENKVVMGILSSRASLEQAIDELRIMGFRNADISALLPSNETTKEFAHVNATKLPEGATAGGATGLLLGGALGWLIGAGSIALPGLGTFIAAGPIMSLLAGAGAGSAVGGIVGALAGYEIPEYEANRYEGFIRDGGYLLSVHCDRDDWTRKAEEVLRKVGAKEISSGKEKSAQSDDVLRRSVPKAVGQ